jgi:hypothetical protein
MYPGSFGGDALSEQAQINTRQHGLESGCFVVCATAWLGPDQQARIMRETGCPSGPISSGCFTAINLRQGELVRLSYGHRRSRLRTDQWARAVDGLPWALWPAGTAEPFDRPYTSSVGE